MCPVSTMALEVESCTTNAMDTVFADGYDHDLLFGIGDGTSFIGFITFVKENYGSTLPCYKFEGDILNEILQNHLSDAAGTTVNSKTLL